MTPTPIRPPWPGTMTARQRFNNQMHYQPVDRCFNMEFGYWNENFRLWKMFQDNGIKNNHQADAFFSFDPIFQVGGNIWLNPSFPQRVIEETEATRLIMNADGLIAEVPIDSHDTIPHYIESSITTPEDWKRCKEERFRRDDPQRVVDVASIRKRFPPDRDVPLGLDCGSMIGRIRNLLTVEGLTYAVYDYPDMVEDMVETCCLLVEDSLDQLLPHVEFDYASGWEDICCKNGPLVSLQFFRDVVKPRYQRISHKLRQYGIDIWYVDCDGDVRPLLPDFLEAGLNCLFPFEVNGCAHPGELLKEYGKELRIMGGVDKLELEKGPDAIKSYLDSLIPWVERGGYIPFCDHRCPPSVKEEDYLFYLDLKRKMFGI